MLDGSTLTLAWVLGPTEIAVIGVVALLLFGKRLPEVARSAGKAVVSFKKGLRDVEQDIDEAPDEDEQSNTVQQIPAPKSDEKDTQA
jgi:sec-independent protein translocase protein TatA